MEKGLFLSVVFLCIINATFAVAGIFLNSVVIISLWRSSQLRRKLCYFMVLLLSCYDLVLVAITHPFLIVSTIYFSLQEIDATREAMRIFVSFILQGFSFLALFTLNLERFLAITCPFFHQASVTKARLVCFEAFLMAILLALSPSLYFYGKTIVNIVIAVFVSSLLFLVVYSNCKLFAIAKSKRGDKIVGIAPLPTEISTEDVIVKKRILNLKNISTCSMAVGCFFFCSSPQIAYSALRLVSDASLYDKKIFFFHVWSSTFTSMNSTFNCLVFFWRNSILRREGLKVVNALRPRLFL